MMQTSVVDINQSKANNNEFLIDFVSMMQEYCPRYIVEEEEQTRAIKRPKKMPKEKITKKSLEEDLYAHLRLEWKRLDRDGCSIEFNPRGPFEFVLHRPKACKIVMFVPPPCNEKFFEDPLYPNVPSAATTSAFAKAPAAAVDDFQRRIITTASRIAEAQASEEASTVL